MDYHKIMPQSDILNILLAHDRWATLQILDACAKLSPQQFHQKFEIGPGSLHNTLIHMLAAIRTWTDTLAARELAPRLDSDGKQRTPAEFVPLIAAVYDEFARQAHRRPLEEVMTRVRPGRTIQITRGAILAHVATHGMHHRAQCLNMLRRFGVSPLPPSSVSEWTWIADA